MSCHRKAPYQGDLDLFGPGAYGALVNDMPEDLSLGDPMPKGEAIKWSMLPDDQIRLVRDWILAGAQP